MVVFPFKNGLIFPFKMKQKSDFPLQNASQSPGTDEEI